MSDPNDPARQDGHRWQPIADLPPDWAPLDSQELSSLLAVWKGQKAKLEGSEALEEFQAKTIRRWSIETGVLERIYTLDEGVTLTLVERGFDASFISHGDSDLPAEKLISILEDHREAAEGLFAFVKREQPLTEHYVRQLHQVMTRHQATSEAVDPNGVLIQVPLLRGEYKQLPNNPGDPTTSRVRHEYCPPEHVDSEMRRLVDLHGRHEEVPYEVEAAWLHHRFTQIHPFQDGNGRVARALATLVCLRAGAFPLVVNRGDKPEYIKGLEAADRGDIRPLVVLFRRQQKDAFVQALSLSQQALERQTSLDAIISDAGERLEQAMFNRQDVVSDHAIHLCAKARERFESLADLLDRQLGMRIRGFEARVFQSAEQTSHYFRAQVVKTAKALGYFANLSGAKCWVRLRISHETVSDLVVAIHHLGQLDDGVMVATAFLSQKDQGPADGEGAVGLPFGVEPVCDDIFTITSGRDRADLETTFGEWLERAIQIGLDAWRRTL